MPRSAKTSTSEAAARNFLRPFASHGLALPQPNGSGQSSCPCPFCGREGSSKFAVVAATGQWNCVVCGAKGNVASFLQQLHAESDKATGVEALAELARDRKLLDPMTLNYWGVVKSITTDEWLVPGWNADGKLTQLYRYAVPTGGSKRVLMATAEIPQAMYGVNLFDKKKGDVWLCEGPWDGMALWEILRQVKDTEEGYQLTAVEESSLLANANVLAVPGCGIFRKDWAPLFAGKRVFLLYDNDHPRNVNGRQVEGAAITGMKKAAQLLATFSPPPREIHYLRWGQSGYDSKLKSGYDVRDMLCES